MREIKFRAWDKIHDKIVSWDLIIKYCDRFSLMADKNYEFMQYTGLKDKNDKEIYEGDIVLEYDKDKRIVEFSKGCFSAYRLGMMKVLGDINFINPWTNFEIIGNIYSNSELLK